MPASAFRSEDGARETAPGDKLYLDGRQHRKHGDGLVLDGVHPGWMIEEIRPEGFEPQVGAMAFFDDGRLVVSTFEPKNDGVVHEEPNGEVWLLDGVYAHAASRRARLWPAFFTGWAFGFGYFILGLFWISEAFLVEPDLFAWMIPFVLLFFPLVLGAFYGVAAALAMMLWTPGLTRIIALAAAFTAAEWIRGNIFTGFPWNAIGYSAGIFDFWKFLPHGPCDLCLNLVRQIRSYVCLL